MKHIILEGPDGAGKTTLARQLCHEYGMGYHHEGPPPDRGDLTAYYAGLMLRTERRTVFDRLHLGEFVYGPLLRGASRLTAADAVMMDRLTNGTGTSVVVCLPPLDTCLFNNRQKTELITDESKLRTAYELWESLKMTRSVQTFDYTGITPFRLKLRERLPDGVIGSPLARLLFIGEQPSGSLDLPFFRHGPASTFLNGAVISARLPERDLAFTNALDGRGHARDLAFIVSQMPHLRTVVPLGVVAQRQLERQECPAFVNIVPMPHPSYWNRFHHTERGAYVEMMEKSYAA